MKCWKLFAAASVCFAALPLAAAEPAAVDPEPVLVMEKAEPAKPVAEPAKPVAEPAKPVAEPATPPPTVDVNIPEGKADPSVRQVDEKIASVKEESEPEAKIVYKQSRQIQRLIMTADFEVPHLLAETARKESGVPYLLILGDQQMPDANIKIALFTPKSDDPLLIDAKDLSRLLAYLRVREIVILGNADIVPEFYGKAIPPESKKTLVNDADWMVNAYKLSEIMQDKAAFKAYKKYRNDRAQELKKRKALGKE